MVVQFAQREVNDDCADLGELALAWPVTVHKNQGSEFSMIFSSVLQHYMLLSRNLLYTELTRAKQLAVVIGLTIKRVVDWRRYTSLSDRLKNHAFLPVGICDQALKVWLWRTTFLSFPHPVKKFPIAIGISTLSPLVRQFPHYIEKTISIFYRERKAKKDNNRCKI